MGKSDPYMKEFYDEFVNQKGTTALLGFVNNNWFYGDLYDLQLGNWEINSDWSLPKKYDTIICLRCAMFARDPEDFIKRCYENLNPGGFLYVDWGLGDHWRFDNYKIGWIKDGEQEYAYAEDNFCWSGVYLEEFESDVNFMIFSKKVKKLGYTDVKSAIYEEVPRVLNVNFVDKYFEIGYSNITLWDDRPQLYTLLVGRRKERK
jgi:SAM-dependent methyltransferase